MERLRQQLEIAGKALDSLKAAAALLLAPIEKRDISVMRFIYTTEAIWKAAQLFLREVEGRTANSPKSAVRASFEVGLLDAAQAETALEMADDRNLAVHTYNEPLAEALAARLPAHAAVLDAWLAAMRSRTAGP